MKTIAELYVEIIEKLKNDQRPKITLSPELKEEIRKVWSESLKGNHQEALKQIFCILDNAQTTTSEFNDLFFRSLKEIKNSELIIYALAASQKHIIDHALKTGNMISYEYFEVLKNLLKEKNPEVKEWTLRTIESMGPMSLRLKDEVLKAKPTMLAFFNKHQKASAQIIDYLEREWKISLKPNDKR